MAEKLGDIYVEVRSDVKALRKDMNNLRTSMNRQTKSIGETAKKNIIPAWLKIGAVILAARKAWNFVTEAKNAARDAIETKNKFDTVFSSLKKGANSVADTFSKSFGLAGSTARKLLGDTGDLLVGFGFAEEKALDLSVQVNELAQDLASFTNFAGGAEGASAALTKGILGETESVKALGIVLRQNTKEFREQMKVKMEVHGLTENQARAEILLAEAYKQSGKAVGDYARTKDDLANVERRANEELKETMETVGKKLTPVFLAGTIAVTGFLRAFTESAMDRAIRRLAELGIEAKELVKIMDAKAIRENLSRIQELTEDIAASGDLSFERRMDESFLARYVKTLEFLRDNTVSLERKQARLKGETEVLLNLYKRLADQQARGADTSKTEELISFHERVAEKMGTVISMYLEMNRLKKENEEIKSPTVIEEDAPEKIKETLGLIAAIEAKLEKLEELKPTLFSKEKIAEVNQEIEILRQKLADFDQLGVFKVDAIDITEDLEMLQALIDEQGQGSKVITGGLGEAGEEFADDMLTSLSAGQRLASTVQSGLFAAGQSFVDHMRDALSVISQVLGIARGFSPAGIVESVVSGATGGGGVSSVPKTVTSSGGGGVGSSAALNQINSSIQAMNLNLISKDMRPVNVINIDADSLVEGGLKPAENRLARSGVNTNDI